MSLFFSKIEKVFNNQSIENDFEKIGNHYRDKTFWFDRNTAPESNCLFSKKNNYYTYDLLKDLKLEDWINEWKLGWDNDNYEYKNLSVTQEDLDSCYSYIEKNWDSLKISKNKWENWKKVLKEKKDNYEFIKGVFKQLFDTKLFRKIFYDKTEKYLEEFNKSYYLKSISDLNDKYKYKIFENQIDCTNVRQGMLGTCYFLEAISTLSNYGQLLYQLFPLEKINDNGVYEICLFHEGEWKKVLVDDYFIFSRETNDFAFTQPNNNCLYSCLLEKAFAKINGSYADINGGRAEKAFKALTGFETISIEQKNFNDSLFEYCYKKIRDGYLFSCSSHGHAYSLIHILKENTKNAKIFQIRNPWDKSTYFEKKLLTAFFEDYPSFKGIRENPYENRGIFFLDSKIFTENFIRLDICPLLFGFTIFTYNLKDIYDLNQNDSFLVFSFEVQQKSKISVSLLESNNINDKIQVKIYEMKGNTIQDKGNMKTITDLKQNLFKYINDKDSYENYQEIEKSKYLLKITLSNNNSYIEKENKILQIIIEGNIDNLNYLGCYPNSSDINYLNFSLKQIKNTKYNYGERTAELFKKYKNIIKIMKKEFNLEMHPDAKGFYIETIITNEVETIIRLDKQTKKQQICSYDKKEDLYITGSEQIEGKIEGLGKIIKDDWTKIEGYIHENKIQFEILEINKDNIKKFSKISNNILFVNGAKIKTVFHPHDVVYGDRGSNWICDFCLTSFDKNVKSFCCINCDYDLCKRCVLIDSETFYSFFESMRKTNKIIKKFNLSEQIIKAPFHEHNLYFKTDKKNNNNNYTCNICNEKFSNSTSFICKECNFNLCGKCIYCEDSEEIENQIILNDKITKVVLGFEKLGLPIHGFTDTVLFVPRAVLPSNALTDKRFIHTSFYIKTYLNYEIVLEYGVYDIKETNITYNDKSFKVFYPYSLIRNTPVQEGKTEIYAKKDDGMRLIKMNYDDYVTKKIQDDSYSKRLFNLEIDFKENLNILLLAMSANYQKSDYNVLFHNSHDFAAAFIRVAKAYRKEGTEHRGFHNLSSTLMPKDILNALEDNENDGWNTAGKIPLVGPVVGLFHLIGKKVTDKSDK